MQLVMLRLLLWLAAGSLGAGYIVPASHHGIGPLHAVQTFAQPHHVLSLPWHHLPPQHRSRLPPAPNRQRRALLTDSLTPCPPDTLPPIRSDELRAHAASYLAPPQPSRRRAEEAESAEWLCFSRLGWPDEAARSPWRRTW